MSITKTSDKSFGAALVSRGPFGGFVMNVAPGGLFAGAGASIDDVLLLADGVDVTSNDAFFAKLKTVPDRASITFVVVRKQNVAKAAERVAADKDAKEALMAAQWTPRSRAAQPLAA